MPTSTTVPIQHVQQQGQLQQAMGFNPGLQPAGISGFPPSFPPFLQHHMATFSCAGSPVSLQNYTGCIFNFISQRQRVSTRTTEETAKGLHHRV